MSMRTRAKPHYREERIPAFFPPVPCTPHRCRTCGYVYHWAGTAEQVAKLDPVQVGKCPACYTGRIPAINPPRCKTCRPVFSRARSRQL